MTEDLPEVFPMTQVSQTEEGETVVRRVRPLTYALMSFVKVDLGAEDTIDIAEDEASAQWHFEMSIDDDEGAIDGYINTAEEIGLITLDIYFGTYELSEDKRCEVERFLLQNNLRIGIGSLQIIDNPSSGFTVRYHSSIDVDGIASSDPQYSGPHLIKPQLIANMFNYGRSVAAKICGALSEVIED